MKTYRIFVHVLWGLLFFQASSVFGMPDTVQKRATYEQVEQVPEYVLTKEAHRTSWSKKLMYYIRQGEFQYILSKLRPYWQELLLLPLFLLLTVTMVRARVQRRQSLFFAGSIFVFVVLSTVLLLYYRGKVIDNGARILLGKNFFMQELQLDNGKYGAAIWAEEHNVSAKYFVSNHCYERYQEWKSMENPTPSYVCAGGYAAQIRSEETEGLAVENGRVINKFIDKRMDGLVMVDKKGALQIVDLTSEREKTQTIEDVTNPLLRQFFLTWAEENEISVFQTHLLASDGELRIDKRSASIKRDLRRLLGLVSNGKQRYIVLFNIESYLTLAEASEDIYKYITTYKKAKLLKLINLDTGYYDVIEVTNERGCNVSDITGSRPISEAVNLFCIYTNR